MENRRDVFGQARCDAILDALHETHGMASTEVLDQVARKAEQIAIEKIGEESEIKFTAYAKRLEIVKSVRDANPLDDVYRGIDKWILLREDQGLPEIPVQVKSSYHDTRQYKSGDPQIGKKPDPRFEHLHKMQIVINCGRSVKPKAFRQQLRDEILRIKLSLRADPTLVKYIKP